ncbi:MAG: carboxypeptidase-like regulatory domain-containing protein, partial [Planctomycetota bacterium]
GLGLGHDEPGARAECQALKSTCFVGVRLRIAPEGYRSGSDKAHPVDLTTDEAGAFECLALGPGTWLIMAKTETFVGQTIYVKTPEHGVVEQDISLTRGATITGTIRHADGSPATEATVALGERYEQYEFLGRSATTDARGSYTVYGVKPGTQPIRAYERDKGKVSGQISAIAGGSAQWNAQLIIGRQVAGRLVNEHGDPLAGWQLGTKTTNELWDRIAKTEEDGSFTLNDVREDARWLAVAGLRALQSGILMTVPIEEGPMLIRVPDRLRPSSSVRLQVLCDGVAPPKPALILITTEGYGRRERNTDESGLVTMDSLKAGLAELKISAAGFAPVFMTAELRPNEVTEIPTVSLTRGGQVQVRFTLPEGEDPAALPSQITVYSTDGQLVTYSNLTEGSGSSDRIAPGTYHIRMNGGGRIMQPLYVEVENGVTTKVEAELLPHGHTGVLLVNDAGEQYSGRVRYRVIDEGGTQVIPWTRQTLRPTDGMPQTWLYLSGLPQGSFVAEIEGEGGARAEARFSITRVGFGYLAPAAGSEFPTVTLTPPSR